MQEAVFIQRDNRAQAEARSSDNIGKTEAVSVVLTKRFYRAVGSGLFAASCLDIVRKIPFVNSAVAVTDNNIAVQLVVLPFSVIGLFLAAL